MHGTTLAACGALVGAAAHAVHRIGWRLPAAAGAVATMALAFMMVVLSGSRQSDQRRQAAAALDAAAAGCEAWPSHLERARCRAALHPLPRDNAGLAVWTPLSP